MKLLDIGRLRHRIAIQERIEVQDSDTGDITYVWETVTGMGSVPAEITPLSAREFQSAASTQSNIIGRIVIRYREGIVAKMRAVHGSRVYNIEGVLPDMESGIDWLTLPVSAGANNG